MENSVDVIFFNEETHELLAEEYVYFNDTSDIIKIVDDLKSEYENYPFKVAYILLYDIYDFKTRRKMEDFNKIIGNKSFSDDYNFEAVKNLNEACIIFFDDFEIIERCEGEFEDIDDINTVIENVYEFNTDDYGYCTLDYIVLFDNCEYPDDRPHPIGEPWWFPDYYDDYGFD